MLTLRRHICGCMLLQAACHQGDGSEYGASEESGSDDDDSDGAVEEEESEDSESESEDDDLASEDGAERRTAPKAKAKKGGRGPRAQAAAPGKGGAARARGEAAVAGVVATKQGGAVFQQQLEHEAAVERMRPVAAPRPGAVAADERPVDMAQRMLTLSAQPDKLPCRDEEKEVWTS